MKGKYFEPTEKARMAVKVLPDEMIYPDTTAVWEKELEEVSKGKESYETFYKNQLKSLSELLENAKNAKMELSEKVEKCPKCGKPMKRHKGKNGYFWGCSGYPECKVTATDKNGKPDFSVIERKTAKCPKCKTGYFLKHKGKKGTFWSCSNYPECKETRQDKNGKPENQ